MSFTPINSTSQKSQKVLEFHCVPTTLFVFLAFLDELECCVGTGADLECCVRAGVDLVCLGRIGCAAPDWGGIDTGGVEVFLGGLQVGCDEVVCG